MATTTREQRIRDPLHNLIEFGADEFEATLWRAIQTRPFQRLRRIKQLGFSELVYPGATHTRFAHSIGTFHTARQLVGIINRQSGKHDLEHRAKLALAGALVHDLGHGMFSHAFEDIGKVLGLKLAHHEHVSNELIRNSEIAEEFSALGKSFAGEVADLIKQSGPRTIYDAVVSSQFDADRLDYMQRDRLMTGVQSSGIDFTWLIANLKLGKLRAGVDEEEIGEIETFVLGPKADRAAEGFVLSLFQLYPNVYFHKATRGAEKLFSVLMTQLVTLVQNDSLHRTGLPKNHPIVRFALEPNTLENVLGLDDSVFWGSLPMLAGASEPCVSKMAIALSERRLHKSLDVLERLDGKLRSKAHSQDARKRTNAKIDTTAAVVEDRLKEWSEKNSTVVPRLLVDRAIRDPYKKFQESKGPLNQIRIQGAGAELLDMAEISPVVAAIEPFSLFRVYFDRDDKDARVAVERIIDDAIKCGKKRVSTGA